MAHRPSHTIRRVSPGELQATARQFLKEGKRPVAARLREAARCSTQIWTALDDNDQYLALWGVAPLEQPGVGQLWMLVLADLPELVLVQTMGMVIDEMLREFDVVENAVDQGRDWALAVFRALGFEIGPPDVLTGRQRVWLEDSQRRNTGPTKN